MYINQSFILVWACSVALSTSWGFSIMQSGLFEASSHPLLKTTSRALMTKSLQNNRKNISLNLSSWSTCVTLQRPSPVHHCGQVQPPPATWNLWESAMITQFPAPQMSPTHAYNAQLLIFVQAWAWINYQKIKKFCSFQLKHDLFIYLFNDRVKIKNFIKIINILLIQVWEP